MAVTLNSGEIVNNCDTVANFDGGSQNTDLFVEGTGSVGQKTSQATNDWLATVGNIGTTAPYDYSVGGGEEGQHIVIFLNVLGTPSATDGGRITVSDSVGADTGVWYVPFPTGYTGGFQSRVINTAQNFDEVTGGFTVGGNPAQMTNIDEMGGGCNVTSKINGNFINAMIDQFTTGTGLRTDAGTTGVPNTFETVRAADEGGTIWGWATSFAGSFIFKGGLYLGPATGTATSVFNDSGRVVIFAAEQVAAGFYVINVRGTGTDVDFTNCVITAEDPAIARWSLTIDPTSIPAFDTDGGLFAGFDVITLQSGITILGTTLDDGNSIVQNGGALDGCVIIGANTATGVALITCDDITLIDNNDFVFSAGHAIELTSAHAADPSTHSFDSNTFTGYAGTPGSNLVAATGSNDAAIYNNSGKDLIINIIGTGDTPSVRNGTGATTVVNNTVTLEIQVNDEGGNAVEGVRCAIYDYTGQVQGAEIISGSTNASGTFTDSSYSYTGDLNILVRARLKKYIPFTTTGTITSTGFSLGVRFIKDTIVD